MTKQTKTAADPAQLLAAAARMEELAKRSYPSRYDDRPAYDRAMDELVEEIRALDPAATMIQQIGGWAIRVLGARATCTSSLPGACRNWSVQVRAKHRQAHLGEGAL